MAFYDIKISRDDARMIVADRARRRRTEIFRELYAVIDAALLEKEPAEITFFIPGEADGE